MKTSEPAEDFQLRSHIEHLVQTGTPEEVVAALVGAPNGADVLSNGFGGPYEDAASRVTFAAYCLRRNRVDIWRAVVEANATQWLPLGAMSASVSRRVNRSGMHISGTETTPHQAAVQAASPEGLRFAIECDPSQTGLASTLGSKHESLLSMAWRRLLSASSFAPVDFSSSNGPADDVRRAVECCRILLHHQAPWKSGRSGSEFSQGQTMLFVCSTPWPAGHEGDVAGLFKEFVAAGWFDVTAQLHLDVAQYWNGQRPLHAAAAYLHSDAAVALLEMGADEREALPAGHQHHGDLLSYVRGFRRNGSDEFAATLTRVLMQRSIEPSTAPLNTQAVSRRVARSAI